MSTTGRSLFALPFDPHLRDHLPVVGPVEQPHDPSPPPLAEEPRHAPNTERQGSGGA